MTSATIKPARGGRYVEREGYGLVLFASVMFASVTLAIIGCFNLSYGIAAVANAHVFAAGAHYVWGDLAGQVDSGKGHCIPGPPWRTLEGRVPGFAPRLPAPERAVRSP